MKYIKLFEDFNQFPIIFDNLFRGTSIDKDEYIDDPSRRHVSTGSSNQREYVDFLKNYKVLNLQDPTKSVHMYLNPSEGGIWMMNNFYGGNTYKLAPQKDANFSYCSELRNGGLGSTWFYVERCLEELLHKSEDEIKQKYSQFLKFEEIYHHDKQKFFELITQYQQMLIGSEIVGNLTYQELLDLSKSKSRTIQVWTESPVLHIKSDNLIYPRYNL
jgi:hypothetical protein